MEERNDETLHTTRDSLSKLRGTGPPLDSDLPASIYSEAGKYEVPKSSKESWQNSPRHSQLYIPSRVKLTIRESAVFFLFLSYSYFPSSLGFAHSPATNGKTNIYAVWKPRSYCLFQIKHKLSITLILLTLRQSLEGVFFPRDPGYYR